MKTLNLFLLFLFLSVPLFSSEVPDDIRTHFPKESVSDTDGLISTIVGGHVNIINGSFIDSHTDIHIPGPNPLELTRIYSNLDLSVRSLGTSWDITLPVGANAKMYELGSPNSLFTHRYTDFSVSEHSGGTSKYTCRAFRVNDVYLDNEISSEYTNCGSGRPSGKKNVANNKLLYRQNSKLLELKDGGGNQRLYIADKYSDSYFLQNEVLADDTTFNYYYTKKKEINQVQRCFKHRNPNATLSFSEFKNKQLSVEGSNGQKVQYTFVDAVVGKKKQAFYSIPYLTSVECSHLPNTYYKYDKNHDTTLYNLVEKRTGPHENSPNFLKVDYYKKGHNPIRNNVIHYGKDTNYVRSISNPFGTLYDFHYYDGHVDVFDAEMNKRTYLKGSRLYELTYFHGRGDYQPSHSEKFAWSYGGLLLSKKYVEPSGHVIRENAFKYDDQGNITKEDLTGYLDGLFSYNTYSKQFTYSNDGYNNLLTESGDEDPTIFYYYKPNSNLVTSKYVVCEGVNTLREFRFYTDDNLCWAETYDDGAGLDHDDLTNVNERLKVLRLFSDQPNCYGKPLAETIFYLDQATGQDKRLKTFGYDYDALGQLIKTRVYDANETFCYALEKQYDSKGRVIWENDPLGHITEKVYDEYGNIEAECGPDKRCYLRYVYDQINRPISVRLNVAEGTAYASHTKYNNLNQVTEKTDYQGQKVVYHYDSLGRVSEKFSPAYTYKEQGNDCALSVERTQYDILGNPTLIQIENGPTYHQRFTSRNNIAEKIYSDGTNEQWRYTLAGRLKSHQTRDGLETRYTYDRLGNKLSEETFGTDGQSLGKTLFQWKGKRLAKITDPSGAVRSYKYDGAGRCIEECKEHMRITYAYDSLGRVCEESTWEIGTELPSITLHTKYDFLDRVIEKYTDDADGKMLARESTTFDMCGREIVNTHWTHEGECHATFTDYDILGRAIRIEDACGRKTRIDYTSVQDPYNEGSLQLRLTTDPLGRVISELYDPYGRITNVEIKNTFGILLAARTYAYDYAGRKTECIESVVDGGECVSKQIFCWEYNQNGDLLKEVRGFETPEQQSTSHKYSLGRKVATIKPDGNIIFRDYDTANRLSKIYDSQNTISYEYTYDILNRVVAVKDAIYDNLQKKTYTSDNKIKNETLYDDVAIQYAYNPLGQLTELIYPDNSRTKYHYRGNHLEKVVRQNNSSQTLYEHVIKERNFQNNPTHVLFAGKGGEAKYTYDPMGRLLSIHSPHFSQTIEKRDADNKPTEIHHKDHQDEWIERFTYDDLGNLNKENGQISAEYVYDSVGNKILVNGKKWAYNNLNQLLATHEKEFKFDLNGNQLNDDNKTFTYDGFDRLITVEEGENRFQYIYDESNRRIKKIHYEKTAQSDFQEVACECYLYCDENEIGTCNIQGEITQLRLLADGFGAELGASIALEIQGDVFVPIHDQRGSIRCLINANTGNLAALYRYDAFGSITHQSGELADICPWQFSGKRYDPETKCIYFGKRYYNPSIGRWTTLDPLGFEGGINGYCYVNNRPFCLLDIYGEFSFLPENCGNFEHNYENYYCDSFKNDEEFFAFNDAADLDEFRPQFEPSFFEIYPGNTHPMFGIGFTNGIQTFSRDFRSHVNYLSDLTGGHQIYGAYNASCYFGPDIFESILGVFGVKTSPVRQLHKSWDTFFDNAPEGAIFLQYCHSQGAINTYNALESYDAEKRKRIHVVAIAPAKFIDQNMCGSVIHYVSRDLVPYIDFGGRVYAEWKGTVKWLPSATLLTDHSFQSETYAKVIKNEYLKRVEMFQK